MITFLRRLRLRYLRRQARTLRDRLAQLEEAIQVNYGIMIRLCGDDDQMLHRRRRLDHDLLVCRVNINAEYEIVFRKIRWLEAEMDQGRWIEVMTTYGRMWGRSELHCDDAITGLPETYP